MTAVAAVGIVASFIWAFMNPANGMGHHGNNLLLDAFGLNRNDQYGGGWRATLFRNLFWILLIIVTMGFTIAITHWPLTSFIQVVVCYGYYQYYGIPAKLGFIPWIWMFLWLCSCIIAYYLKRFCSGIWEMIVLTVEGVAHYIFVDLVWRSILLPVFTTVFHAPLQALLMPWNWLKSVFVYFFGDGDYVHDFTEDYYADDYLTDDFYEDACISSAEVRSLIAEQNMPIEHVYGLPLRRSRRLAGLDPIAYDANDY